MNPAVYKLLDAAITAVAVGLEREAVLGKISELEAKGATPEEIAEALVKMRDDALDEAARVAGA